MRSPMWLILPLGFLGATALAALLTPSPTGLGTHQALGLPPCLFHALTGWACPSCGLTTSITHLIHGNLAAAFWTHPLGPIIYLAWGISALWACLEFFGRSTPLGRFLRGQYATWAYGALAVYLVTWGSRLVWNSF